jgi:hypothetical protein
MSFTLIFCQAVYVVVLVMFITFLLKSMLRVAYLMIIIRSSLRLYLVIPSEYQNSSLPIIVQCLGSLSFHCAGCHLHSFNNK